MARKLLLIDGDQFVFKATVASERETRWDDHNHVLYSNADEAWQNFEGMMERIFARFETRDHVLAFSSSNNFRYGVDETYKSNRKGQRKPMCYAEVRRRTDDPASGYNSVLMDGLEADDVMGILATKPGTTQRIIVSQDKDMRTIPTTVWNGKDLLKITEEEADRFFYTQTLTGDITDGYKGLPGCGPVKAEKLLAAFYDVDTTMDCPQGLGCAGCVRCLTSPWHLIVPAFEKAGLTEEHALQQARLARILRWEDWDTEKKVPILWTP